MLLKPFELRDNDPARRKSVLIFASDSACRENLKKSRFRSRRFRRIPSSDNNQVANHFSGVLDPLRRHAAAICISEQVRACLGEQCWIGGLCHADNRQQKQGSDRGAWEAPFPSPPILRYSTNVSHRQQSIPK